MPITVKDFIDNRSIATPPQQPAAPGVPKRRIRDFIQETDRVSFREFQDIYRTPIEQPRQDEQDATAQFNRIRKDLERMGQGDIEAVENWQKVAETIVRLKGAEDEEAAQLANSYMQQYGEQLKPHVELVAGADWWDKNYEAPPEPSTLERIGGAVFGNPVARTVLGVLDRPSQATLHALRGVVAAVDPNDNIDAGDALRYSASSLGRMLDPTEDFGNRTMEITTGPMEGAQLVLDRDGDGALNLREAVDVDPDAGGRWLGLIDTIGVITLDPLTYATFGAQGLAKGGMQAILRQSSKEGMSPEMARLGEMLYDTIRRRGTKEASEEVIKGGVLAGLTPWHRDLLKQWIDNDVAESMAALAAREADPTRRARLAQQARRVTGRAAKTQEQRAAEMWRAVERGGQAGVRIAGRTVVPYSPLLRLMEGLKITRGYTAAVANGAVTGAEALDEMVTTAPAAAREAARSIPADADVADNILADYAMRTLDMDDVDIELDALEEIIDSPVVRSQLRITADDIVDQLDRIDDELLPPISPKTRAGIGFDKFRFLRAKEWEAAQPARWQRAATRKGKEPIEMGATRLDQIAADAAPRTLTPDDLVSGRFEWLRRMEPTEANRTRLTRPEVRRLEAYKVEGRAMSQSEKRMLLALEDQGLTPYFDDAEGLFKVDVGDATYTIARDLPAPGQPGRGAYLTPPAAAGTAVSDPRAARIEALRAKAKAAPPRTLPVSQAPRIRGMIDEAVDRGAQRIEGRFTPLMDDIADGAADTLDDAAKLIDNAGARYTITYNDSIFDKLYNTRFMRALRHKFIPRAKIINDERRQLGKRVAQQMDDNMAEAVGTFATGMDDLTSELHSRIIREARDELGDEFDRVFARALSSENGYEWGLKELKRIGSTKGVAALEEMMRIRAELAVIAGQVGTGPFTDNLLSSWMPTRLARQVNDRLKTLTPDQLQKLEKAGFINPRTGNVSEQRVRSAISQRARLIGATPKEDLLSVNSEAADILRGVGLDPEVLGDLFVPDVVENFLYAGRQAMEKKIELDLLDNLADEGLTRSGHRLAYRVDQSVDDFDENLARQELAAEGVPTTEYRTVPVGPHLYFVQTPIYKEYEEIRRVLQDKNSIPEIVQIVNKWNGLWSTYATVPFISGFTYHARNLVGNLFNAYLGGVRNPARYAEAFQVQRTYYSAQAYMRRHGGSFDDALRETGASQRHAAILKTARAQNVIGTGQTSDVFNEVLFQKEKRTVRQWIDPRDQRNIVTSSGRALGTAIEDNARLALFINGLESGMSPRLAARDVRKFLFDYSDLTKFEHDTMRTLSRFYTFMRKNTALQAQMLAMYPGRVINAQRIADAWTTLWFGEDDSENFYGQMPPWMRGGAPERIVSMGGLQGTVSLETPLIAAADTVEKLGAALSIVPVLGEVVPEAMAWGTVEQRTARALSLLAGGPVEMVDFLYGERFARDPFSGAPLDMDTNSRLLRAINTVIPLVGRVQSQGYLTGTLKRHWLDSETADGAEFRTVSALLGFTTYAFTEDRQRAGLNALRYEAYEALQALEESGTEIPTLDELIEAGKISAENQAITLMLRYEATTDPEDKARLGQAIESIITTPVMDAIGMWRQTANTPEATREEQERSIQQLRTALTLMRESKGLPPLTEDEWVRVLQASAYAPANSDQERIGVEPERTTNVFDTPEQQQRQLDEITDQFDWSARQFGLDPNRVRELRPLLTDAQRVLVDAAEAGLPRETAIQYLISELGRKEQGLIFGTDTLSAYRDGTLTLSQENAARERAWQRASEFSIIVSSLTGRMPTEDEALQYAWWNELTNTQLEAVGLAEAPRIPSAKDVRSDAEKTRDAWREAMAVRMGVLEGPG